MENIALIKLKRSISLKKNVEPRKNLRIISYLVYIQDKLEKGWTPEQIHGRFKLKGLFKISFKSIYNALNSSLLLPNTVELLPRKGKKRKNGSKETRGIISGKNIITERSREANNRSEIGHFKVILS
jgi:IS30 family transposase